jgi:ATP-dependent DNA helicase RecG
VKEVLQDVAETLVAMANADGGTVAVGLEDDGTVTGVPPRYELHRAQKQLGDYIRPTLKFRAEEITLEEQRVWILKRIGVPKCTN